MSSPSAEAPLDDEAAQGEGPVEVELSAEEAAALYSLGDMLNAPALAPDAAANLPARQDSHVFVPEPSVAEAVPAAQLKHTVALVEIT